MYYFDHRTPASPNGASHADELPYVFGTLGSPGRPAPRGEDTTMSARVMAYWTNFAKTGNPNDKGLPQWPAFTEQDQRVMVLDAMPSARAVPNVAQLEAFDGYYAWRRGQVAKHRRRRQARRSR